MTSLFSFPDPRRLLLGMAAALAVVLLAASPAHADYEQVPEHFGESGEAEQLQQSMAVSVNVDGVGGVEAGSIYVVGRNGRVLRFSPGSEGEAPQFREAWGWGIGKNEGEPLPEFQRCGPAYAAEPRPAGTFAACRPPSPTGLAALPGEQVGHFGELGGVAVDQATGDVYVLNVPNEGHREHHLIEVFSPTGEAIGEGFGDWGRRTPPESIAEGPQNLHELAFPMSDGIAVDEAGTLYAIDGGFPGSGTYETRVMSFEPCTPGDYESYCYAGQDKDITASSENSFNRIALVGSNRLVAGSEQLIREYATGGGETPLCERAVTGGQETALAANQTTGEVFYVVRGLQTKLRRLGACNEASKEFVELQAPPTLPQATQSLYGLAVNPSLAWGPLRSAGVLYGADGEEHGGTPVQKGIGDIFAPAVGVPPVVESESVLATNSTSTTLRAQIDPRNQTTEYAFQYLTQVQYEANPPAERFAGAAEAPVPPATLDSSHIATAPLTGLSPETTYRFRAIAASHCIGPEEAPCEATGEAASFSTYPTAAPGLPDGRAYELVSPAQKNGGEVFPSDPRISSCGGCKPPGGGSVTGALFPMKTAPGGDAVAYEGYPFSPEQGAAVYNSYISRRTATGWQTTAMSPRRLSSKASLAYSESLGQGLIAETQPTEPQLAEDAPAGYGNLYRQQAGDPAALEPLLTEPLFAAHPPQREPSAWRLEYKGHSPDFSAQYFAVNDALTGSTAYAPQPPDPGPSGRDLYEWRAGALSLINVLPGNAAVATGASFASASPDAHGMSTDGRRVFWEAGGQLYVREDNRTTREIHDPGAFLTASPDGRTILLSDGCLYALEEGACAVDVTQGQGGFLGLVGQSEDLSRIYFADKAALSAGAEAGSCQRPTEFEQKEEEQEGLVPPGFGCNLYLYEAGAGIRFVATLAARDGEGGAVALDDWASEPGTRTAEASPDGRYLAFGSSARLTGYGNVGPCEGAGPDFQTGPCKEAFLYDSASGKLSCPSCNPSGEAPLGNSTLRVILNAAQLSPWLSQPRYLTNRGRLFFDSQDRLSVRDTNGGVEDVYEYEPNGVGSCERAQGCVTLISPGSGEVDSNFLSMGGEGEAEGSGVFFTTRERLVPIDTDELIDLYDARVGGGFAAETETTRPECQGEACQPAPNPPAEVTPASAAFQGAGNLEEGGKSASRCPKGKRAVKSRGKTRCVAKHKKKHKRHHRRKQRRANADRRAHR